jgi:kumamolisin
MFATLHRKSLSLSLGLLLTGASAGTWAANATPAVDAGMAPTNQTVHVTLFLKLHHEAALEDYIRQTVSSSSPPASSHSNTAPPMPTLHRCSLICAARD